MGIHGGLPGGASRLRLNGTGQVPSKGKFRMHKGDRLTIDYAGGGGYGKPADRQHVRADLRAGIISAAAAREIYKLDGVMGAKPAAKKTATKKAIAGKPAKTGAARTTAVPRKVKSSPKKGPVSKVATRSVRGASRRKAVKASRKGGRS